jgi:general secretion pathway protein K
MRLAETFRDTTRATYLSRGGLEVGRMLLQDDDNNYDAADELWAIGIQQYPVADGSVTIKISDLDGRVALNLLVTSGVNVDTNIMDRYRRLLEELDADNPAALVDTLIDWIDTDDSPEPQGAENSVYISRAEPIQCKNGQLDTIEELALVEGYSPELLEKLRPHVTVYGRAKSANYPVVNINTVSREVLLSLHEDMDDFSVDALFTARQEKPFTAVSQVQEHLLDDNLYFAINKFLAVKSQHYQVESTAWVNDGRMTLSAIVAKQNNKILFQRVL